MIPSRLAAEVGGEEESGTTTFTFNCSSRPYCWAEATFFFSYFPLEEAAITLTQQCLGPVLNGLHPKHR
ncbi:hypothetical protein BgiBS90_007662, partial [Biomphalaria glabrata]